MGTCNGQGPGWLFLSAADGGDCRGDNIDMTQLVENTLGVTASRITLIGMTLTLAGASFGYFILLMDTLFDVVNVRPQASESVEPWFSR